LNSQVSKIKDITAKLLSNILNIQNLTPDSDEVDKLVSDLQVDIETRRELLEGLLKDESFVDRDFLVEQFDFTQSLIKQSNKVMQVRQALLKQDNTSKRQINIYKSIDSNR
jgi:hypothetical protein